MKRYLPAAVALLIAGAAQANDFPTQARVEFVLECMNLHGGEGYGNLYKCSCMLDRLAANMAYDDYVEADTWYRGRTTIGERGGIFRDVPRGHEERSKLEQVRDRAEKSCFGAAVRRSP